MLDIYFWGSQGKCYNVFTFISKYLFITMYQRGGHQWKIGTIQNLSLGPYEKTFENCL